MTHAARGRRMCRGLTGFLVAAMTMLAALFAAVAAHELL